MANLLVRLCMCFHNILHFEDACVAQYQLKIVIEEVSTYHSEFRNIPREMLQGNNTPQYISNAYLGTALPHLPNLALIQFYSY